MKSRLSQNFSHCFSRGAIAVLALILVAATLPAAFAQSESVIYTFCSLSECADGNAPHGTLIMDSSGNLYGTTFYGGAYGNGTAYKLAPDGTETVLFSFGATTDDGKWPAAGVVMDSGGNLYGTTEYGGPYNPGFGGGGTAFKISSDGTQTTLHEFGNGTDGQTPGAGLIVDHVGNVYGTTEGGGSSYMGTIFKIGASGIERVLHNFSGSDGEYPEASLITDKHGNFYATAYLGGTYNDGTVFEFSSTGVFTVLYSFGATSDDGQRPFGNLVMDAAGNMYGTTELGGGTGRKGTVFKLSPTTGGGWTERIVYAFGATRTDGLYPAYGLVLDGEGNLYGTALYGGANGEGSVFKISPSGTERTLYNFTSTSGPSYGGLLRDAKGDLFGVATPPTTNVGEVYELTP